MFADGHQVLKQCVFCCQLGVVLNVVNDLAHAEAVDRLKLDPPGDWLPLKIKQLVDAICLIPAFTAQWHAPSDDVAVVALWDSVL